MAPPPSDNLQKMRAGDWYTCLTDELESLRQSARTAVHQHNTLPPDQRGNAAPLLRNLFAAFPDTAFLEAPFHCPYGFNIHIGENSYLNAGCTILDTAPVAIGAGTLLGPGVHIYCADHHHDPDKRAAGLEKALPVTIGDNVWIGGKAVILPGVTIGDRAIVGAGSIVTKDVPSGVKVVGNPARPV